MVGLEDEEEGQQGEGDDDGLAKGEHGGQALAAAAERARREVEGVDVDLTRGGSVGWSVGGPRVRAAAGINCVATVSAPAAWRRVRSVRPDRGWTAPLFGEVCWCVCGRASYQPRSGSHAKSVSSGSQMGAEIEGLGGRGREQQREGMRGSTVTDSGDREWQRERRRC
jgi:hypothetical protein